MNDTTPWKSLEELEKYCYMSSCERLRRIGSFIREHTSDFQAKQNELDSAYEEGYSEGRLDREINDQEESYDEGFGDGYKKGLEEGKQLGALAQFNGD